MRRISLFATAGVLVACLVTWVAALQAQTGPEAGQPPTILGGGNRPLPPPPTFDSALSVPKAGPETPVGRPAEKSNFGMLPQAEAPKPVIENHGQPAAQPFASTQVEAPLPESAAGRQEPAVSLEWVGTPVAKVGQAAEYSILVRNICSIPVQQVSVRVRIPQGLSVVGTEPRATPDNGVLLWEVGTLMAKQERLLRLNLQADAKGDVTPQAWVTFTGSSVIRIKVREPKLTIKASVPDKILVGDPAAFTLTVANPGDGSADQVKIHAVLSDGLEHARGKKIDFDIGNLAPGESRNVTLLCATAVGGAQKCEVMAEADGGLKSQDVANINVIMPRLDLAIEGPGLRYLDRKALYTLKVTNPGDAPATNVTVQDAVPAGFKVLAASDGGRHDFQTRTVSWFLGEIGPGQTREVKLEVQAVNVGEHRHKATAVGARGLRAEIEKLTRVEGLAALLVEMVDVEDPIEVGGQTSYEVRILNTGSKAETDIKLVANVPDKMQFAGATYGGQQARYHEEGKTIVFESLPKLEPKEDATYRINVKALDAGTVRFRIQVTSTNLTEPVIKMEATRIYSDAPESSTGSSAPTGHQTDKPTVPMTPVQGQGPGGLPTMPALPGR